MNNDILTVKEFSKIANVSVQSIYKRINNKIADCITDERVIIINPDIVKYDKETIEYILIHQLCHLKYKTHSKGFFELLNKYITNYNEYEDKINERY